MATCPPKALHITQMIQWQVSLKEPPLLLQNKKEKKGKSRPFPDQCLGWFQYSQSNFKKEWFIKELDMKTRNILWTSGFQPHAVKVWKEIKQTSQEGEHEKQRDTKRKRTGSVPVGYLVCVQSKSHQSLRFGHIKVCSIYSYFPQPFKGCQPFICFGLM